MKKYFSFPLFLLIAITGQSQIISVKKAAKDAAVNKTNNNIENGVNSGADKAETGIKSIFKKKKDKSGQTEQDKPTEQPPVKTADGGMAPAGFKAYNNYDFVPGDKILFEDNFRDDQEGEFASHWKLEEGQGVVNKMDDDYIFAITKYYTHLSPLMKTKTYLPAEFTVEFDAWLDAGYDSNNGVYLSFNTGSERIVNITTGHSQIECDFPGGKLSGELPKAIANEAFHNKWHHFAIAVKNKQIKVYCDQYRVLVVPDANFKAYSIGMNGDASENMNMMFKNFRLAAGGGMNMLGKKFTDTKIVTHGINFDYNKASIKPESMGTLSMVVQIMKDNPEIKFEIGGHTDADGEDNYNLKLSQQRAEAVKSMLVKMGIEDSRLSTKGYGETKPLSDNNSPEGKANNRRVEFVKL